MGTSNSSDELKRDAVQQIRVRGYPIREVSQRLGVSLHSLYKRLRLFAEPGLKLSGIDHEAVVASLKDMAVMGQAIVERGDHLGITDDRRPFAEAEVGSDDHAGALVELAQQVEEQRPARGAERQVGLVIATAKPAFLMTGGCFDRASSFAAWFGIALRQHSSGGKERTLGQPSSATSIPGGN